MKILMTGSSGFVGSALSLIVKQHFDLHHLKSDLCDYENVKQEVLTVNPDIIIHLGARTEVEKSFYEQLSFSQINYLGTINLIESAKQVKNFKKFIFASTMEVYGWQSISDEIQNTGTYSQRKIFDEKTIPNPNAPYAVAKFACEKYLEYANRSYDFPFVAIRQTNTYGRKDNNFFVTEAIISRMLDNPHNIQMGYAEPWRNFLFIDDLIDIWMKVITEEQNTNNLIMTIGPDNAISIKNYVNKIAKKLNWQGEIEWNKQPQRNGEIYWLNSGNILTKELFGWEPKVSLDDGLEKTIEIWKEKKYETITNR